MDDKLYDNADWYFEKALKNYCLAENKAESTLDDQDFHEAEKWAGLHIAMFMTWIVRHHFESGIFSGINGAEAAIGDLCAERITGSDFLEDYCDGKLHSENLSEKIIPFLEDFYEEYFKPFYVDWVIGSIFELPFEFGWSWEDYHDLEEGIDKRYNEYLQRNNTENHRKHTSSNDSLLKKLLSEFSKKKP